MGRMTLRRPVGQLRKRLDEASPKLLVISLVASAALLLRDAVVVGELGLSVEMDGYVAAVSAFVLAGSALVSAAESSVVPELARLRSGGSRREVEFMVAVLAGSVAVGLFLSLALWALAPWLGVLLQPGSRIGQNVATDVLRWLSVMGAVGIVLRGTCSSILTSYRRFLPAVLTPLIGASLVVGLALVRPKPQALALAFGIGLLVEASVLLVMVKHRTSIWVRPTADGWRSVAAVMPRGAIALTSSIVFSLNPLVDLAFASGLDTGDGAVLATAGRIPLAVAALLVVALVTPQYPRFAEIFVAGGRGQLASTAREQARFAGSVAVAFGLVLAVLAYPISLALYSHGAIDAEGTSAIATNMSVYAATVPFYVAGTMCVRALIASGRVSVVLAISVAGVVINIAGDAVLGSWFGATGVAAATAIVYAATLVATYLAQ